MLEEAKRTLKAGGILAVLPFHMSNFRDKDKKKCKYSYKKLIDEIGEYGFKYIDKDLEGVHFEKVYSPYYQQKGGVTFDSLEHGKFLIFERS
jgi:ubiquinone/menaquinone biosynthesis C-methylase UbiE